MKTITLLLGACAVVALPVATPAAGPCTAEIENVTKLLASKDAGSGPTAGATGTTTGQHPPTAAMGAADSSTAASAAAAESALNRNDGEGTCCNLMDCRPAQSRMVGDHYEVKVDGE